MSSNYGSFPHPVMGNNDDVSSQLGISNILIGTTADYVEVDFRVTTSDEQLRALVENGFLKLIVWWHCSSTMNSGFLENIISRKRPDGWMFSGVIDHQQIRDKVEVSVEIVAPESMDGFSWENQHADYGDAAFNVLEGDYVGLAGEFYFKARKLYDAMNPPVGSLFRFEPDKKQRRPFHMNYEDDDAVIVYLSEQMKDAATSLWNRRDLQIALLVLPALVECLGYISKKEETDDGRAELESRGWYRELKTIIRENNANLDLPLDAAQRILGNPTLRAIENLDTEDED